MSVYDMDNEAFETEDDYYERTGPEPDDVLPRVYLQQYKYLGRPSRKWIIQNGAGTEDQRGRTRDTVEHEYVLLPEELERWQQAREQARAAAFDRFDKAS